MYLTKHIFLEACFVKYVKAHEKYAEKSGKTSRHIFKICTKNQELYMKFLRDFSISGKTPQIPLIQNYLHSYTRMH